MRFTAALPVWLHLAASALHEISKGYPFRLTEQQHSEIADKVFAALKENPTIGPEFDKKQIIPRSTEASQLVEEHLISPSWRRTAAG